MNNFYLYEGLLPSAFVFPHDFLNSLREDGDIGLWWYIAKNKDFSDLCLETILEKLPSGRFLIPFAKSNEADVIACFDGNDCTANPRVFNYKGEATLTDMDWDKSFKLSDFDKWVAIQRKIRDNS
ncbi:hypothetical protein [Marinagarivorans algicola]|uniref:hypothetical protein n=1 Tax=Marinagarivorans algicola TaxID=1513270 RepID=UPI003735D8F6